MSGRPWAVMVLAAGALTLAACGGSAAANSSSTSGAAATSASFELPDPCTLLSSEQVATIIGVDPGSGTRSGSSTTCRYPVGLELGADQAASYMAVSTALRSNSAIASITPLTGLGDQGQVVTAKDGTVMVMAQQGDVAVFSTGPGTVEQFTAIDQALLAVLRAG